MKSMQEFTESLANMKLPMDIENSSSIDNGNVVSAARSCRSQRMGVVGFSMEVEHSFEAMLLILERKEVSKYVASLAFTLLCVSNNVCFFFFLFCLLSRSEIELTCSSCHFLLSTYHVMLSCLLL
ncbi:hypothetical protein KFK09_009108 [Dendrobium nobile]|uniref:Uncharacterized protein n=1 Tax=Dendrobium nobile TaxID=94219 RepID=A0A8T3BSN7_DENNO|nr:hypothetical protein KFK09_009108 [Dendrobium nobile]